MLELYGYQFELISEIEPQRNAERRIIEKLPQGRYKNEKGLALNKHGGGPFCEFKIGNQWPFAGVYAITLDRIAVYIGECQNLSERFGPRGYGSIHPRNCFMGGQSTNCKLNNLVMTHAKQNREILLWFLRSADRKSVEAQLIPAIQPKWNTQLK